MENRIEINSFNPYESRFPNRKLIDIDTLKLVKYLRNENLTVLIRPDNSIPVQYLFRKGVTDIFANPLFAYLIGIPTGLAINIISNYVQKMLDGTKQEQKTQILNNIIITNFSQQTTVNLNGKKYLAGETKDLECKKNAVKDDYKKAFSLVSPFTDLPIPIFFQHTPKLVGWCKVSITDVGLEIDNCNILDKNVFRKIASGKIKGASITGIAEKTTCSICGGNYVDCNHIAGNTYGSTKCKNAIEKATIVELSLVKQPVNAQCLVSIKQSGRN